MKEIIACLKNQIDRLLIAGRQIVIMIDGDGTSCKTTLTAALEKM